MSFLSLSEKPEVARRPGFLLRRILRYFRSPKSSERIVLPWNLPLTIKPLDTIGRQIWVFGVFDLPVCETLWRLADPGEAAIDIGANIGQMTSLLALRVGPQGKVISFEPHPEVRSQLESNLQNWKTTTRLGEVQVESAALADQDGDGLLHVPQGFNANCGLASTVSASEGSKPLPIVLRTLDRFWGEGGPIGVVKVDVEGAEVPVLHGAEGLLRRKLIRDLIFEHHDPYPSSLHRWLEGFGYRIMSLRMHFCGPVVREAAEPSLPLRPWDSPSYLATSDARRATERLGPAGWKCL